MTPDVALPNEGRFRKAFHVLESVFKYGFGVSERVLQPHLSRNIYHNNSGLLCPLSRFKELRAMMGEVAFMRMLRLQRITDSQTRVQEDQGFRKKNVFCPTAIEERSRKKPMSFFEKVRRHRERFDRKTTDW